MTSTHTPGPWLVNFEQNKFDSRHSKVQVVDGSSASLNNGGLPLVLANVNAMPFNDESVPLANARLIASAPELLSTLEELLETAESLNDWLISDDSINGEHELFQKVRAMISKAKGLQ